MKNEFTISPAFDYANNFSHGLAWIGVNGDYNYINKKGERSIRFE